MRGITDALFNNFATRLIFGASILYGIYWVITGNLDNFFELIGENIEYIISSIIFIIYILMNKEYIENYLKQYLMLSAVFLMVSLLAYIETDSYLMNMFIIIGVIVFSLAVLKYIVIEFQDRLSIQKEIIYSYFAFYLIGCLMVNDNVILFSLINAFTVYLAFAYTTYIPANIKIDINKIYEKKKYKGLTDYFHKKTNKINKSVVTLMVLSYFIVLFFIFFKEVNVITLLFVSISLIVLISLLSKYNHFKLLKYTNFNVSFFKEKAKHLKRKKG